MQIKREQVTPTSVKLTVIADQAAIDAIKQGVLSQLSQNVRVPGFRPGKAPAHLIQKSIDQQQLQTEFLDRAINQFYVHAVDQQKLRPVAAPNISLTKFVPYSTVEFTAEVEVVGAIKLPDYKKIKLTATKPEISAKDITDVLDNLRQRAATKKDVTRAAKTGDEVTIDFKGTDAKTGEPIEGADGQDYPLIIGSSNFIPGFEEQLVGVKPAAEKVFTITFPKDYATADLQKRKVSFAVTVKKIQELTLAKLDDSFATSIGPFKTVADLKADIKKQLTIEKQQQVTRAFENELIEKIAAKSTVAIPKTLVDEEIDRIEEEEKRNIVYRGQTWQEHLDAEGLTAEEHHEKQRQGAEIRVKAGLVLGEISQQEQITVTPQELEVRIQLLKGQYTSDATMQAELDKSENRQDVMSRLLTEKTLDKLRTYATK